ncbi:MAG TPA: DMT family transporter [Desulfuromonadales bacterium]|nr:DMT family transporter [Desulfuromonadales bacterium]
MVAFAGNSLLCRMALKHTGIDAASFTALRLLSGALALGLIVRVRGGTHGVAGTWTSAAALFAYAAGFSFAYLTLPAGVGALILFGAVQGTMIGCALWSGERLRWLQVVGLSGAFAGLVGLLLPGLSSPPLQGSILMLGAGVAWGVYSLRGRNSGDPTCVTAGNFLRAVPFAIGLSVAVVTPISLDSAGVWYAIASGALASGLGYAVWYSAVTGMLATTAAAVQLSVPVLAAAGGVLFLGEPITLRLLLSSLAILGGLALFIAQRRRACQSVEEDLG